MEKIINLWKELGVTHINFEYSCGGDSMNDTTLNIHKGDEIIENDELDSYFDNEVYKRVEFYVNSDGHYQGESGNVLIELNDDETDFNFMKSGTSEYNETITSTLDNFTPDIEEGGEFNDWFNFTTNEDDISDNDEIRFVDNKMLVTITNQYYVFINDEN